MAIYHRNFMNYLNDSMIEIASSLINALVGSNIESVGAVARERSIHILGTSLNSRPIFDSRIQWPPQMKQKQLENFQTFL